MRVLITGSKGMLGAELVKQLQAEELRAYDAEDLDITNSEAVDAVISEFKPEVIFNCAAYNNVDKAEIDAAAAETLNAHAPKYLAIAAEKNGAILVHYSTGFVFSGLNPNGYTESDQPDPGSVYAKTKYQGEQNVLENCSRAYVIRLNVLFGPAGKSSGAKKSFVDIMLDLAKEKDRLELVDDEVSTPTYVKDLAEASIRLVKEKAPYGIYHLANEGQASWFEFAKEIFKQKGVNVEVVPISSEKFTRPAGRPKFSVILNTKLPKQRHWREALAEYLSDHSH